ncbi:MAG: heavy metal-binding domain-containing protein [Bacteroidales bacterium]|jgi:ssDNA-binding Zn-finger/Zn-ribbon topoisomerase 1|nr:heavy metal-binding domain-containing protein [Bacteroidales bacterium]
MKKSILVLSLAFMAIAAVTFTACDNAPKTSEEAEATKATEATEATEQLAAAEYQCPMKCEGEKSYDEMGKCPECGMDLKVLDSDSTKHMAMETYQCPMKCEGEKTYAEMGSCPECGMDLKALDSDSHEHDHSEEGHTH